MLHHGQLVDKYFKTILQRLLKLVALDSESATGSSQGEAMDHDAGEAGASSSSSSSGGGKKKRSQKEHELHKIRVQKSVNLVPNERLRGEKKKGVSSPKRVA